MEKIDLQGQPLDLDLTLSCGQAFRWYKHDNGLWSGVVQNKLMELVVKDDLLFWRTYPEDDRELVHDYLRLSDDINGIYSILSKADPYLGELIKTYRGMRLLRQDPSEALLSFICSAANSIPRIMNAVETLSRNYGDLVCEREKICYHAFPRVEVIANADVNVLRKIPSLAFRGKNIKLVAQQILERGDGWLMALRGLPYKKVKQDLIEFNGVGAKIADCVCLFALDKDESVPVDTHVRQLAHRLFLPEIKAKSLTNSVYRQITDAFIQRYGKYAGWAQQFLFYEDLMRGRKV